MRRKPRAYLSVPVIKNYDPKLTLALAEAIEEAGFELISRWALIWEPALKPDPGYVFKRDVRGVRESDVLVAEISAPSHGVGMEIMLAHLEGKPIVCLCREGEPISAMIKGLPRTEIIRYGSVGEAKRLLKSELEALSHAFAENDESSGEQPAPQ